jgi:NADH:ubiquinone oxidoreductase subunit 4 (subunit M)
LTDATWEERLSTATLILAVAAIGCFPNFFINIISSSFAPVVEALQAALPVL